MITRKKALRQYLEADAELKRARHPEHRLTSEQQAILQADREASAELSTAHTELTSAVGTPGEEAALARFQKAQTLARIRAELAKPLKSITYVPISEAKAELDKFHKAEAYRALAYYFSTDLIEERLKPELLLEDLRLAYMVYRLGTNNSIEWPEWLAQLFPPLPKWNPVVEVAKGYIDAALAKEIREEMLAG